MLDRDVPWSAAASGHISGNPKRSEHQPDECPALTMHTGDSGGPVSA